MYAHGFITPILALVLWTLVIWVWMYATRIPAMRRAGMEPQAGAMAGATNSALPPSVRQIADNYNHLMEQPTIFYAAALAAQAAGATDHATVGLAWGYVTLRVLHSLIQCTINVVVLRFAVFSLATIALAALVIRTGMLLAAAAPG